jgi:uncharacterized protein (DUF362 family)
MISGRTDIENRQVIIAGTDPVAVDLVAVQLMGFDEQKLEKLRGPKRDNCARSEV